jgi:hypothetical protein
MRDEGKFGRVINKSIFFFIFFLPFLSPVAYVGLLVALIFWFSKGNLSRVFDFKPRFFGFALLGLILAVLLSIIFSIDKNLSFGAFALFIFYPLTCLLIADNIRSEQRARKVLTTALLSATVVTIFGIVQYCTGFELEYRIGFITIGLHSKEGLGSTLGNPNKFAKYLDLVLPLSFVSLLVQKPLKRKILPGILAISGLVCLVLSKSLGGMAAVFLVIMVILLIKNWKIFLVVMGGLFIFTFLSYGWMIKNVLKYGSPSRRIYTWREVVPRIFKDHPLVGSGLGTYKLAWCRKNPRKEWFINNTNPYEGTRCIQATVAWGWLWQDVAVKPERHYTLSAYVRSNIASSENTFLTLECINDKGEVITRKWGTVNTGPSWELKETQLYMPQGARKIRVKLAKRLGEGSVWFDQIKLIGWPIPVLRKEKEKLEFIPENMVSNSGFEMLDESGRPKFWSETPGRWTVSTAHSLYFTYLSELGIIGLASLLLVIAIFFYTSIRYLRKHSFLTAGGIIGGCTLSVLAALIHGTVETFLDVFPVGLMFWVVIGLGMGLLRLHYSEQDYV